MNLFHPKSKGMHIVVEGVSDIKFLNSMLDNVFLYESFSGKTGVFEILEVIDSKKVIGICDRDFDESEHERVIYYDGTSLEAMMIMSDDVFDKVLDEFLIKNEGKNEFKSIAFLCATPLTHMRKESYKKGWNLKFEGIRPVHYIKNKMCNTQLLLDKCSEVNPWFDIKNFSESDFKYLSYSVELLHGHDLSAIIAYLIEDSLKKDTLEMLFRVAYNKLNFANSQLAKNYFHYLYLNFNYEG
jgi:hypothetical protein